MADTHQQKGKGNNIRSRIRWGIVGILVLLLVTSFFDAPGVANRGIEKVNQVLSVSIPHVPEVPFQLGLDLQGGAHLVYQADVTEIALNERAAAVEGVRDVIERRVNAIGVGEPSVRTAKVGDDFRINVELPGVEDVNEAITRIGETPTLEFREQNNEPPRDLTDEEREQMNAYNDEAETRAEEILSRIQAGEDFETLATELSEDELSKNNGGYLGFLTADTAETVLYEWAQDNAEGTLSRTLVNTPDGYSILRRGAQQEGEVQVTASHILICYSGALRCEGPQLTKDEALQRAQEIFEQANASNFADLAREFSTDGAAASGGDLGTFGPGAMVESFEGPVFEANVGEIVGPVETEFGYHIIYKTDEETTVEYELWRILVRTQSPLDILPPQDPWIPTGLSGSQLDRAEVTTDHQTGVVQVSLQFDSEGTELFRQLTEKHIGQPIAIFLDGTPISIPVVQVVIPNGQAVITGNFNLNEARLLAQRLNAGALPVPVELISQQSIGASLGAESLQKSLSAGAWALVVVMLFMIAYYRLPGVLSVVALALYFSLTLAIFKIIGVTLSLAGIAGLILSIGMAVDANVLIFERLKEELRKGKSLKAAVEEGFLRAWTSIRDGNISTLITCFLLMWFGSSFVQGFAVTLAIGVLISMFSAITITRILLRFVVPWFGRYGNALFLGAQKQD